MKEKRKLKKTVRGRVGEKRTKNDESKETNSKREKSRSIDKGVVNM